MINNVLGWRARQAVTFGEYQARGWPTGQSVPPEEPHPSRIAKLAFPGDRGVLPSTIAAGRDLRPVTAVRVRSAQTLPWLPGGCSCRCGWVPGGLVSAAGGAGFTPSWRPQGQGG